MEQTLVHGTAICSKWSRILCRVKWKHITVESADDFSTQTYLCDKSADGEGMMTILVCF